MEPLASEGCLETTPLPRVLLALCRQRFDGVLTLTREHVAKRVRLRAGMPVLLESTLPSEGLLHQLIEAEKVPAEQEASLLDLARRRGGSPAKALLERRLLEPKELLFALREQARRGLLACFAWDSGAFALEPGEPPAEDAAALRLDPLALVEEGLARHWSPERALGDLAPTLGRYAEANATATQTAARLGARAAAETLLKRLDGTCTLDEAIRSTGDPRALAAAWILDALEALAYRDAPLEPEKEEAPAETAEPEVELEIVVAGAEKKPAPAPASGAPAPASGDAASAAPASGRSGADALRKEILEKHAKLDELDHYTLLGVERDANAGDVKRAYLKIAKRIHPDALSRLGLDDVKSAANALFARVGRAQEVLSNADQRRDYDASLSGEAKIDVDRLAQAETLFRKGEILLRAGNFVGALEFLEPTVKLWPEEAAYQSALGWALHKKTPPDSERSRAHLAKAVALDENDAVAHFRLGIVLRGLGDGAAAASHLARAKELDPKVR